MTLKETAKHWPASLSLVFFILFSFFWLFAFFIQGSDSPGLTWFANTYWITAFWGGAWGLYISSKWGGFRSIMGRSIIFFSLGLLLQIFGQLAYSYYYYGLGVEAPYPSIGDIGFFGSIFPYIYAVWLLGKASGVKVGFRSFANKIWAIIIPILMVGIGYILFLRGYEFDWSNPLVIFLDFGYPLFQAIYVSLAILTYLLSRKTLGGVMKNKILLILLALILQFYADYSFLFQTIHETWVAGGSNDYVYLAAYTLMSLGLFQLGTTATALRSKS